MISGRKPSTAKSRGTWSDVNSPLCFRSPHSRKCVGAVTSGQNQGRGLHRASLPWQREYSILRTYNLEGGRKNTLFYKNVVLMILLIVSYHPQWMEAL